MTTTPKPVGHSGARHTAADPGAPIVTDAPPAATTRPPPRHSPLLDASELTGEQQQAVRHEHGPLLVYAGPGTGKTETLTYRAAYLIEQDIAWSQRIAAVTFTRRAADEMRARLVDLVGPRIAADVTVATTHSLCWRIVRAHAETFGRRGDCEIYDTPRLARLARQILNSTAHRDLKNLQVELDDPPVETLLGEISLAKNRLWTREHYLQTAPHPAAPLVAALWELIEQRLIAASAFDLDDLLCLTARLLQDRADLREHYSERHEQLLIDEYQDLNDAQIAIFKALKSPGGDIAVFADDDQALYGFRGATPESVLRFADDFPGTRTVTFTQNFRCRDEILAAALRVISHNRRRHPKPLRAVRGGGGYVGVRRLRSDEDEAAEVAETIRAAIANGRSPKDLLVLSRNRDPLTRLQPQLVARGIKVRLVGGQSLWERSEIKDAVSILQLLGNPYDPDATAFARALTAPTDRQPFHSGHVSPPTRGAGEATAAAIHVFAATQRIDLLKACIRCAEIPAVAAQSRVRVREFGQALQSIRQAAFAQPVGGPSLASLVDRALRIPGGPVPTYELLRDHATDWRVRQDANRVLEDLRSLSRSAARYEDTALDEEPSIIGFLDSLGLEDSQELTADHDDRVTLVTIHSAKGCEAATVLLIAAEESILPGRRQRSSEAGMEDERRLFYTALTRARDTALLFHVERRAGEPTDGASRFLAEAGLRR